MRTRAVFLLLLALLLVPAQRALACSMAAPHPQIFSEMAEVVAIGTLANATPEVISLQVEEYLKGGVKASELKLNNHHIDIDASCKESLGAGGRLPEGQRVLIFLTQENLGVDVNWRPTGLGGSAIFALDGDQLKYIDLSNPFEAMPTLAEARDLISAQAGQQPFTPEPGSVEDRPAPPQQAAAASGISIPQLALVALLALTAALGLWYLLSLRRQRGSLSQ